MIIGCAIITTTQNYREYDYNHDYYSMIMIMIVIIFTTSYFKD